MAETTQQAVSAKVEDVNEKQPEFILTKTGVMIVGSELVGDKLTALLCEAISMNAGSGLASVILRDDNYPRDDEGPVFAMTFADTHSFAVNLQHCWDRALAVAEEGDKNLSLLGILWVNLLSSIGHEIDHIDLSYGDRELFEELRGTEEGNKDLETAAKETAQKLIMRLSLLFDVEMPAISDMGIFGSKWMELMTGDKKDEEWVVKARKMAEEGILYEEPENDIKITSFRDFVKLGYDPDEKYDWDQTVSNVNLEAHLEGGEVETFRSNPVEEPKTETVEMEEEAPVEAIEVPAQTMAAATAFVGAGEAVGAEDVELSSDVSVPLPEPVAAQQQTYADAAATSIPPAPHTEPTYEPHNLSPEVMAATMKAVWQTIYHHVFTKCGWQQNPQTGRFFFANAAAVLEGVNITHIINQLGAENFIMEYETLNATGQYAPEKCQGMIRGHLTTKQGLPCYTLYLNIGGQRFKRSFLPQNPEKIANNAYTNSANDAAAGNMIAWVFKGEVSDNAPFKEKCAVKIRNNEYEVF